jgi:hypothetical protein
LVWFRCHDNFIAKGTVDTRVKVYNSRATRYEL